MPYVLIFKGQEDWMTYVCVCSCVLCVFMCVLCSCVCCVLCVVCACAHLKIFKKSVYRANKVWKLNTTMKYLNSHPWISVWLHTRHHNLGNKYILPLQGTQRVCTPSGLNEFTVSTLGTCLALSRSWVDGRLCQGGREGKSVVQSCALGSLLDTL